MTPARRLANGATVVLLCAAGVFGCSTQPLTRDEADYPEHLRIPPDLVGELDRPAAVAQGGANGTTVSAESELPAEPGETVPSRLTVESGEPLLRLDRRLNRVWRETLAALDRLEFTIVERLRDESRVDVRYAPRADEEVKQPGLFARWFRGAERIDTSPQRYRIVLDEQPGGVEMRIKDADGEPAPNDIAEPLLRLLDRQLYSS